MAKKSNLKYSIKELYEAAKLHAPAYDTCASLFRFVEFLETNPLKKRSLIPSGGNDCIMTPPELARKIVGHFRPHGFILEPCMGDGGFYDHLRAFAFEEKVDWCELSKGRDFLLTDFRKRKYQWIITNPPFSKLRAFLKKSMELADNIVFLCPVNHILGLKARKRDVKEAGFFVREVCRVEKPIEWPSSGFEYAAIHLSRQAGDCKFTEL